jgi:DNA-binding CsgD family transcriptional regulator
MFINFSRSGRVKGRPVLIFAVQKPPMDRVQLLKSYRDLFVPGQCAVSETDYEKFGIQQNLLVQLSGVENSSMAVFDMHLGRYAFVRSKFDSELHYPFNDAFKKGPEYFFGLMPDEDLQFTIDTVKKAFGFLAGLAEEERKQYKLIFEFRLSDPAGNLFRFLQQCLVLECDRDGRIWMVLILNDLVPNRPSEQELLRKLVHMPSGRICLFRDAPAGSPERFLSKRETEVLGLLSQGMQSQEISDRLFISVNTVNNHRQRIIGKLNAENTHEALRFARTIGII